MTAYSNSNANMATKFKFQGDPLNATFRHEITIKPEFRTGQMKSSSTLLQGYSKHVSHAEPVDKEKCFVNYVGRMILRYHAKSTCIEFFQNGKSGHENDECLCYVTPKSYYLHPKYQHLTSLVEILERAKGGTLSEYQAPTTAKAKVQESDFIYKLGHFKTLAELIQHCDNLIKVKQYPRGRVEGYYYDAKEKFNF